MSDLYTTPAEARSNLRKSTKTGNYFQDSFTDSVSSGISLDDDGSVKREGLAWWMQGLTPGAQSIAEQKKGIEDSRKIDAAVQASQLTDEQLRKASGGKKLTSGNVRGTVAEGRRQVGERITPLQQSGIDSDKATSSRLLEGQREGNQLTREGMSDARTSAANQMELARMDSQQRHNQFLMTQADSKDQRAMELQIRREEMDRLDRKDERGRRRDSIAALTSGLAALGAAFAL
jgi:hypothetical protein